MPVTTTPLTIDRTMPQAGGGDFDAVYRGYALTVARWAVRLGGPRIDAEDVVQDVFTVVARRLAEFRGDAKISTWLFRITENTVRNRRRQQRLRQLFGRDKPFFDDAAPQAPHTPFDELARRQSTREVYALLDRLSERSRKVLVLAELEELSTDAIAEMLETKPGTVRVWLHRARAEFLRQQEREERRSAGPEGARR
jgi:RNA polymerase sigma-70 factor (ECF subfamily)